MSLSKIDSDILYKKALHNTQADALFCSCSFEEISVSADADIPTYQLHSAFKPTNRNGMHDLDAYFAMTTDSLCHTSLSLPTGYACHNIMKTSVEQ